MASDRPAWRIRRADAADVGAVVAVHMSSFPGFFLTFLGQRFLKLLYTEIQSQPVGILHVAETDGRITGFVAGVTEQAGFYRHLVKRRKWAFAIAATNALLRSPTIALRLVRALGKPHDTTPSTPACLMSLAVAPESASSGIGAHLVQSFTEEMRRRSIHCFCLTTDRDGNDKVNAFYRKCGFELRQAIRTDEGRWMNEYVMEIR